MGEPADVREGAQPQLGVQEKREDAYGSLLGVSKGFHSPPLRIYRLQASGKRLSMLHSGVKTTP